jgi:hexosaminidase
LEEQKKNKPLLHALIPKPNFITYKSNNFIINRETTIISSKDLNPLAIYLNKFLNENYNLDLKVYDFEINKNKNNYIAFQISRLEDDNPEAYHLTTNNDKIELIAPAEKGIFYGIQTLIQLISHNNPTFNKSEEIFLKLNCVEIKDTPRFPWRGFMLDEGRHFFGKEIVKNILDIMALLKLNTFHWHLSDDQGWRIEIKKYPKFIEIGSRRKGSDMSKHKTFIHSSIKNVETDGIPVIGFYTQEDVKEIINYAAERYITVIPEIDMPGHTMAMLAAYPELSCKAGPFKVGTRFGIYKDILCVGKEIVFEYIKNILSEIIELFPSEYIHIGGDETPKSRWKRCPDCQARMVEERIESLDSLQVYFTNRVANFLLARGKKVLCWNDTVERNLNKEIYCQYWNANFEKVFNELKQGRQVIISELNPTYLNYPYKTNSLENTYYYNPIPKDLPKEFHENIIGIEACVWTEYIKTREKLEWQLFPRLFAIAEIGWTYENKKNYLKFEERVVMFFKQLEKKGINYAQKEEYDGKSTSTAERYFAGT